jgi:ElaB/YqjD/DUF883 family membrane-anchored ribosome-binding protein
VSTPESNGLTEAIRRLEAEIDRMEAKFVRSDIIEMKFDVVKEAIKKIDEKVEQMVGERSWLLRIVLGANVMAVIGLVLNRNGVL